MPVELSPFNQKPISAKAKTSFVGVGCLAFFFSLFAIVGAGVFYFLSVRPVLGALAARSWPSVPCQISSSSVSSHSDSDGTSYRAEILYNYRYSGQTYHSDRFSFAGKMSSSSPRWAQNKVNAFPVGSRRQCFVNPRAPSEAVLDRSFNWEMGVGAFGLLFLAVGLGAPIGICRSSKRQSRLMSGNYTEYWRPQSNSIVAMSGGGVLLKPSSASPMTRMLGAWLICAFWNGITGSAVWAFFNERSSRALEILPTLFLIPFVLVGLLLLPMALYHTLALFNSRPFLILPLDRLRPGDSIEFEWQLRGGWGRSRSVTLLLEGIEEVRFTRGTDTITQKQVFHSQPLYNSPTGSAPGQGKCRVEIPADTMHSFEAPHNALRWVITLKAPQSLLPTVQEEWRLLVEPHSASEGHTFSPVAPA